MSKTIPFFDLFSDYIPERELRILLLEVLIEEAAIDKEALTMSVKLLSSQLLPESALEKVQEQMCQLYRLKSVELSVRVCAPEPAKKKKTETTSVRAGNVKGGQWFPAMKAFCLAAPLQLMWCR